MIIRGKLKLSAHVAATIAGLLLASGAVPAPETASAAELHSISGVVTGFRPDAQTDGPLGFVQADLFTASEGYSGEWYSGDTDHLGGYTILNVPDGEYILRFTYTATENGGDLAGWAPSWYGSTPFMAEAEVIVVDSDLVLDIRLDRGAVMTGSVFGDTTMGDDCLPYVAWAYLRNPSDGTFELLGGDGPGDNECAPYTARNLPAGQYRLEFADTTFPRPRFQTQYWNGASEPENATLIEIESDQTIDAIDALLPAFPALVIDRLAGDDRFATTVLATQLAFPGIDVGIPVAYIASGLNYPDALSAGPAAAREGGALLTVSPTALPDVVLAELNRLDPQKIIVVGSASAVSDDVVDALDAGVPSANSVVRISGTDRYDTSRQIGLEFPSNVTSTVFLATGRNFPDALAAGPAAAQSDSPVLLVDGAGTSVGAATRNALVELGASRVVIIGSIDAVSQAIEQELTTLLGADSVARIAGDNRFQTATSLNYEFFTTASHAFLATGMTFADALGGGGAAAAMGVPLYLSPADCLPGGVLWDIDANHVLTLHLLGGPNALGYEIESRVICT